MPQSISLSVNRAAVVTSSSTTSSRISHHVNDAAVPAAARRSVHDKDSAVPAAASQVNTADDIASQFSNMSISKPTSVKHTSASSSTQRASKSPPNLTAASASKGCPPLLQHQQRSLNNIAPSVKCSVTERINERRRRVLANLAPASRRPTLPVKTPTPTIKPSTSSRAPALRITITTTITITTAAAPAPIILAAVTEPDVAAAAVKSEPEPPAAAPVSEPDIAAAPVTVKPRQYGFIQVRMPGSFRQGTDHVVDQASHISTFVEISDAVWSSLDSESLIPSMPTNRTARTRLPGKFRPARYPLTRTLIPGKTSPVFSPHTTSNLPRHFSPVYLTIKPRSNRKRGRSPYCPAVPVKGRRGGARGNYGYGCLYKGRNCDCPSHHGKIPRDSFYIRPHMWATTPAESGVDPYPCRKVPAHPPRRAPATRPLKVRFADELTSAFEKPKPRNSIYYCVDKSTDGTRREEDFPEGFPLYDD